MGLKEFIDGCKYANEYLELAIKAKKEFWDFEHFDKEIKKFNGIGIGARYDPSNFYNRLGYRVGSCRHPIKCYKARNLFWIRNV